MGLEREYKFLLNDRQYFSLWERLRGESALWLQENAFFDHDELFRGLRWVLRLRVEGKPVIRDMEQLSGTPLKDLAMIPLRSAITLKGPRMASIEAVVRPEEEEAIGNAGMSEICPGGLLNLEKIPPRLRSVLTNDLGSGRLPTGFEMFASFRNLRLSRNIGEIGKSVEVALDRSESYDGRLRYELEIEASEEADKAAKQIMHDLDVSALKSVKSGKFAWLMRIEE